jgi:hypothetical protein
MGVGVLELVNVPKTGKVLLVDVFVDLKRTDAPKESLVRFIDFHNLKLLLQRNRSILEPVS